MNQVTVTISGPTGSGKSAIAGEIEIMCKALGLQVEWVDGNSEKNLTGADWTSALEMYQPMVRIVEAVDKPASDSVCTENDGCPTERAVLQRFWRSTKRSIQEQREQVKDRAAGSDWWKGYAAALYWVEREAFVGDVVRA